MPVYSTRYARGRRWRVSTGTEPSVVSHQLSVLSRQKYVATEATRRFVGVDAVVVPGGVVQFHW